MKQILQLAMLMCMFLLSEALFAQSSRSITGTVKNQSGSLISGVTVTVKGTNKATATNENGAFTIEASNSDVLVFTIVGYATQEVSVAAQSSIQIVMSEDTNELETVVVTALGIKREARTLTYATQTIDNSELTTVKTPNLINSLNGKVSGVQINKTSGGTGGSVRIVLRGDKSTRNSQPLFVIDGIPILNISGNAPTNQLYNNLPDQGDVLSTINQEDIETMSFLKGASASALYGSAGSNGVVLITTKKGKAGVSKVDFSSGLTVDQVFALPDLQFNYNQTSLGVTNPPVQFQNFAKSASGNFPSLYAQAGGATTPGSLQSWANSPSTGNIDHVKPFFNNGNTWINSVNLSSGNEKSTAFFSYSNTENKGIIPTSTFKQHNLNLRTSSKFFNDKLTADATIMGSIQNSNNRITPGIYFNPLTGLYLFPRGLNFEQYANNYEVFSQNRYLNIQNWWNINWDKGAGWGGSDTQQNPFWILNRNAVGTKIQNIYSSLSLKYDINDWLYAQVRGNYNNVLTDMNRNIYATTQATLGGDNGRLFLNNNNSSNLYGDFILSGNKNLSDDFTLSIMLGTSIQHQRAKGRTLDTYNLRIANVFAESNVNWELADKRFYNNTSNKREVQSVFGSAQIGYKNILFLDLTDRHDWSSTLAFTPSMGSGYNYYSVGLSGIVSDIVKLPEAINFAKLRASYAFVGNDIEPFRTYPLPTANGTSINQPDGSPIMIPGFYLQPEENRALEVGADLRLINNKLNLEISWYKSNIKNQFFRNISVPPGLSPSGRADVNGGNIQNIGLEITSSYRAIQREHFEWTPTVNFSTNKNKVVELFNSDIASDVSPENRYELSGGGFLSQGGSFGDFYGFGYARHANGQIIVDANGIPLKSTVTSYFGNPNPRYIVGLNNMFRYKDFSFSFLIDGKFGHKVMSMSEPYFDQYGVSKRSADAREQGGVKVQNAVLANGTAYTGTANATNYYTALASIPEAYVYDGQAIRLRELSIFYKIPLTTKAVQNLNIGFIGNNLFFLSKKAPFDPEQVTGVNAGGVGVDVFGVPPVRSYGLSVRCSF